MQLGPDFAYLNEKPELEFPPPPVATAAQVLPFDQLTWENFEQLCYRLARLESAIKHVARFGERGQNQSGIDLYALGQEEYSVFQCRRVARLTARDLAAAVDDFLAGDWAERAQRFVFCTSQRAVRTELAEEIQTQRMRLEAHDPPIAFEVWDAEELSAKLKELPALVSDFFGPAWHDAFIPDSAVTQRSMQLAEMAASLQRLEQSSYRVRFIDWAPTLLKEAIKELGEEDPTLYARLDDVMGDPPDSARVVATVARPDGWLAKSADPRPWQILAMVAEKLGEWGAARHAWVAAADRSGGEVRVGYLVSGGIAAELAGDASAGAELLQAAEELSPSHPRVVLQRLDQRAFGPERLAFLEGVESDDPGDAALLATHRALANMLLPDMDEADRYVAEAKRLLPESLMVKATAVNAVIQRGRIASNEHRIVDYAAMWGAHEEALRIRDDLKEVRRYEESLRLLMLAVDALTVVREPDRARTLIGSATTEELATPDAAEVLGDAALRARAWDQALSLAEGVTETDSVRRIRASAHLESGGLFDQNRAIETLDGLIAARGREAPQAALFRLAATLGSRRAEWSDDAADALVEEGFESAALGARARFLALRQKDYAAAEALLAPHDGVAWADEARLQIALMRGDLGAMVDAASSFLARGAVQEDRLECAVAFGFAGQIDRAHDILMSVAHDLTTPPATRADAYSILVSLVVDKRDDWQEAARLHREWVELRPGDVRASAWAPRIANNAPIER